MAFDRKHFFDHARALLKTQGLTLTQKRVKALEFLLGQFEKQPIWGDKRHVAYALATIAHETAWTFEPIVERGQKSYFNRYDIKHNPRKARELGNINAGDGYTYRGRGYVQITGRSNYAKYGIELTPDMALDPYKAFDIMTDGMFDGRFTGRKLQHYLNNTKTDYINARRIINGTDKAKHIADIATAFEKALVRETKTTPQPTIETPSIDAPTIQVDAINAELVNIEASPEEPKLPNLPSLETVQQQIPRITSARTWLGGLGIGGALSTFAASIAELPPWSIFILGVVTSVVFIALGWLFVTYYKQLFGLVNKVIAINADPTKATVELVSRREGE